MRHKARTASRRRAHALRLDRRNPDATVSADHRRIVERDARRAARRVAEASS